jgi:hypothetical protein
MGLGGAATGANVNTRVSIAIAATSAALALGASLPAAQAATATPATVVYGFGGHCPPTNWSNPLVRPARAFFSLACENGVRRIHWQSWHRSSAFGHATILIFNGLGFTPHGGTISLSDVRRHLGRRYFSHLVMNWTTRNGRHHRETLNWRRDGPFWIWVGNFGGT